MQDSSHLSDVLACEERLVNCWPAIDTLLMDGWVVRAANGYSGRANSASAVRIGATLDDALLREIVRFFRAQGLPPAIRVTPLAAPDVAERLAREGWRIVTRSGGMIAGRIPQQADRAGFVLTPVVDPIWCSGVSALQDERKRNAEHLYAIVSRIRREAGFATVMDEGRAAAFGMVVIDRGMAEIGSIIVNPAARGRGIGRGLVRGLMAHAAEKGAIRFFLQVEAGNAVAQRLYASLGFEDLYPYVEYRL